MLNQADPAVEILESDTVRLPVYDMHDIHLLYNMSYVHIIYYTCISRKYYIHYIAMFWSGGYFS